MEKMKELYEKVAGDAGLQAKFAEIMKDAEKAGQEATETKLTAFAEEAGFHVTIAEMQEFFKILVAEKAGQLSDMELDAVAGGKSENGRGNVFGSVATLGITCAVGSLIFELEKTESNLSDGCLAHFQ